MDIKEDPYVVLARNALEHFVRFHRKTRHPGGLTEAMTSRRAGVFVMIKKHGELRGCVGTMLPTCRSIAEEIMQNAIRAGLKDPRFPPVAEDELESLSYTVDILGEIEPIQSKDELDPGKYGIIVRRGGDMGILLPNLEGVNTAEEQLTLALQKGGIGSDQKYTMERFEVERHE